MFLPGTITSTVGSPSSNYAMAIYDLAEDEALIVELDQLPDGVYWSFQLGDVWSRSQNYMYRQNRDLSQPSQWRTLNSKRAGIAIFFQTSTDTWIDSLEYMPYAQRPSRLCTSHILS